MNETHTEIDKLCLEFACKCAIISRLKRTGLIKKDPSYIKYIAELSYYQTLSLFSNDKKFLLEFDETEADHINKVKNMEAQMRPYLGLSFSIAAGGPLIGRAMAMSAKVAGTSKFLSGSLGMASSIGISMGLSYGAGLLAKLITYIILRRSSPCYKKCNNLYPKTDRLQRAKNGTCETQCKLEAFNTVRNMLKTELTKCNKTDRPMRCSSAINAKISEIENRIDTESQRLIKNKQRESKAATAASSASTPLK